MQKRSGPGRPNGDGSASDVLAAVAAERVSEGLRCIPLASAVNATIGAGTFIIFAYAGPAWPGPACWLAAIVLVAAARLVFWRRARGQTLPLRAGEAGILAGALAAGLAWGVGAALLAPEGPALQLFVVFVIAGMSAGAITTLAAHFPSLAAFVLSACLPLAFRFLLGGSPVELVMGGMGLVFVTALLVSGCSFSKSFGERIRLQWQLNQANRQLRAEIDEHRATEASLRESQKLEAIGRLTAGIAHDFNNLLMAIRGQADLLERSREPADRLRRVDGIRGSVDRGSRLIRQLLAFGSRQLLQPQTVDLNVLLAETVRLLGDTLGRKTEVAFKPGAGLWQVSVDPGQIEHAILNLAINARDAMPAAGGRVEVGTSNLDEAPAALRATLPTGRYVEIAVADTGSGMSPDVLARAVEPFFTTKGPGQGSGLGLSQVYGIARQSGGGMTIESVQGAGTTVRLILPRARG